MDIKILAIGLLAMAVVLISGVSFHITGEDSCLDEDSQLGAEYCMVEDQAQLENTLETTDNESSQLYGHSFVSVIEEGEEEDEEKVIDETDWTTVTANSDGEYIYNHEFDYGFAQEGNYTYNMVLSETESTDEEEIVEEFTYEFTVVSADAPDEPHGSLNQFLDNIAGSIGDSLQSVFEMGELLPPY